MFMIIYAEPYIIYNHTDKHASLLDDYRHILTADRVTPCVILEPFRHLWQVPRARVPPTTLFEHYWLHLISLWSPLLPFP